MGIRAHAGTKQKIKAIESDHVSTRQAAEAETKEHMQTKGKLEETQIIYETTKEALKSARDDVASTLLQMEAMKVEMEAQPVTSWHKFAKSQERKKRAKKQSMKTAMKSVEEFAPLEDPAYGGRKKRNRR